MITVVMPSFSSKLVKRVLEINNNIQIIIIENSKDMKLKELEAKYENVEVVIPEENLGWGKAINLGIKSKNEMVFITQPDVKLMDNCVSKLEECIKTFNDFSILTLVTLTIKYIKTLRSTIRMTLILIITNLK